MIVDDAAKAEAPTLVGTRFALVPLTPDFYPTLYRLSIDNQISFRWRYRGLVPSFEAFCQSIHANVLVQFVVVPSQDVRSVAGWVIAYNPNFQDGYCFIAACNDRTVGFLALEGCSLMIGYIFAHWSFRKLYLQAPEFNASQFRSGVRRGLLVEEGRLHSHHYFQGRYWDEITFSIEPKDFDAYVGSLESAQPGSSS